MSELRSAFFFFFFHVNNDEVQGRAAPILDSGRYISRFRSNAPPQWTTPLEKIINLKIWIITVRWYLIAQVPPVGLFGIF